MYELALPMTGAESTQEGTAVFEEIMLRYERRVFLTAFRLLGSMEDAQDAAQEVFLRLHKNLRSLDLARALAPWLYRVTVNVCRDMGARRGRERTVPLDDAEPAAASTARDWRDERRIVALALRHLPEKERAALVLRDIEGLATAQVAARRPSRIFALRWWHGLAAGAAAAVVAVLLLPGPAVPPPAPPPPPSEAGPRPAVAAPARAARGAAPRKPQEPLLVKMFTDDPDVVIYWLVDQNGDSL